MIKACPCTVSDVQDEVQALITKGVIDRNQFLYALCQYFSDREWQQVELLLEFNGYLLRDRIGDLIPCQSWSND